VSAKRRFITTQVEVEGRVETKVVEVPESVPAPWNDESLRIVGVPVPRVDGLAKVTGAARYTTDEAPVGLHYAVLVRSSCARGRVAALDPAGALAVPGVRDVVDAAALRRPMKARGLPLFSREILYAGQPIAAVCASTRAAALAGARALRVEVAPLPFVLTVANATAAGAPRVRESGNVVGGESSLVSRGDIAAGLHAAEVTVTREYETASVLHSAMEPHGAVASWDGDELTIHESTQGVFRVRDEVASALGIPRSRVRVIMEAMGGGFGAKNNAGVHTLVAAVCARRLGRPVACILDREGEQTDSGHRPSSRQVVTLGATRDGRLTAIDAVCEIPLGVGGWEASAAAVYHEMYACPNVRTRETFAYVNQQAMDSFRAPGHAEGAFALERAMDTLARALAIDPLELRRRNFAADDQARGRPYSANRLLACYEEGARRFGWGDRESRRKDGIGKEMILEGSSLGVSFHAGGGPQPRSSLRRGFGLAAQVWGAGGGPPAYATVRLHSDGSVDVLCGTQDLGTGARTALAQIAAEALGAQLQDVRVILGDTGRTPYAGNSWGSMTTASVGPAVRAAAEQARATLLEAASELLGTPRDDLVTRDSTIRTDDGATCATFRDVTRKLGNVMIMGHGSRGPNAVGLGLMSFGAQFAEVLVDVETGVVRVVRLTAVHDVGRVVNPLLAGSQLEGGILMGLGYALSEERVVDAATGRPLNTSLHEYKLPTLADAPLIDATCLSGADDAANAIGARGLAEPPLIPTAPAIANAVADALGVEVDAIPLTPWRILAALGPR
jgi:xanthine dehydrogenase YagR molybdenum-binding subunit